MHSALAGRTLAARLLSVRPRVLRAVSSVGPLACLSVAIAFAPGRALLGAGEIGFVEEFALAEDRAKTLEGLVPGTEEAYYYTALHLQHSGKLDDVDKLLAAWIERHGRTERVFEIENRQAFLRYASAPRKSLDFLVDRLGLTFHHQREVPGAKPELPTKLDPQLVSWEEFARRAFERNPGTTDGFEDGALERLAAKDLDPSTRRHLLARLDRPDVPGLVRLVVDDLATKESRGFGSLRIHNLLLLDQLEECWKLRPALVGDAAFVNAYLVRLWPGADVDWRRDAKAREAYLERLWRFATRLPPAHNSLKVHILYHRLAHDRAQGVWDRARFLEYLKLPRSAPYVRAEYLRRDENRPYAANLGQDYRGATQLPPVGNDEPLVRSYLQQFFLEDADWSAYAPYIDERYLRELFAETKILAGLGDAEKLSSLLPPEKYQALKERVDIDFAWTNRTIFEPGDPVSLEVWTKNVKTLTVKVFELNTLNCYLETGRELDTAVDLDGLVANEETTHAYSDPPLRRVQRRFDFPELRKRGAWVVEFVGGGVASRALVLKGRLGYLERLGSAGHVFTVVDEAGRRVEGASLWLGGRRYQAEEDGRIVVPYSNAPGPQKIVLEAGGFASLEGFAHRSEEYQLLAGFHVEREALVAGAKATVAVRPFLAVNGVPASLDLIEDATLEIESTDHDGVSTTKEVKDLKLAADAETTYEFQVPPRVARLKFALRGRVENLSQGKKVDLRAERTFELNGIDRTEKIEDIHLAQAGGAYHLELLGKTGEPRPDRPVRVWLKHRDFREPAEAVLQSDARGRVELGPLEGIAWVKAEGPEGTGDVWNLAGDWHDLPGAIHAVAGDAIYVPCAGAGAGAGLRSEVSLLEVRGQAYARDLFETISQADGYLRIDGLPPGDYHLFLKRQRHGIGIRVATGEAREGYALGGYRQLELRPPRPLQIAGVAVDGDAVKIRLEGWTKASRVHVAATRYVPEYSMVADLLAWTAPDPGFALVPKVESLYVVGRDLGDEIRYILERKRSKTYPGNFLARPSLLLNPWAIRTTETGVEEAKGGGAFDRRAAEGAAARKAAGRPGVAGPAEGGAAAAAGFSNLDFLARPASVLLNLRPGQDGVVSIPRKDLGAGRRLHVIAADLASTAYREVSLPDVAEEPRDLRLAAALDPEKHFTERRSVTVVEKGSAFAVADVSTAEFETYDTLAKAYRLLATLTGDANLVEFGFIVRWPKLAPEEKRALYSKYACHELNVFLYEKDPEFFRDVVRPYLESKLHKTFLDRWLLGEDLKEYLDPWAFGRLNAVERILLGRRIAEEGPRVARHIGDAVDLIPPDLDREDRLFETALRGRSLETAAEFEGVEKAREEAQAGARLQMESAERAAPAPTAAAAAPPPAALRVKKDRAEDKLEALVEGELAEEEFEAAGEPAPGFGAARGAEVLSKSLQADAARRRAVRQLFRKLEKTQEWVENNYYKLPIEAQDASLVTPNAFWRDFAAHAGDRPFLSRNLAEASRNFAEMMLALAVLDLPFEAAEHKSGVEKLRFELRAGSPLVVYHKEIQPAEPAQDGPAILVTQHYYRHGERYVQVGSERRDKFVTDEFLAGVAYGCHVVVTNPTSSKEKLDVLLQVPKGAIPVAGGRPTRGVRVELEPYRTWTADYFFYFPKAGTWTHFPVHVAKEEKLVAFAKPSVLKVVGALSAVDRASWEYVSQNGTEDDVIEFLKKENLGLVRLERIAWRMRGKEFFRRALGVLRERHAYDPTLWSYGFVHGDADAVREYLKHADAFLARCGPALESPLLTIDPVERRTYQHMEYWPLVNARAHQLGKARKILNDRFAAQYARLLAILAHRPQLDDEDHLTVTLYLLLQDRVEEALRSFAKVRPGKIPTRIQYDYFDAYLGLYTEDLRKSRLVAEKYAAYPVERWKNFFGAVLAQLDEIEGKSRAVVDKEDRTQVQGALAATEPALELEIERGKATLRYQNLSECQVAYYVMDIELLFSRNPFVGEYGGRFSMIRPNASETLKLEPKTGVKEFEIPEWLRAKNVLVEVSGGGRKAAGTHFSGAMSVQVVESYAQLKVTDSKSGKGLPRAYVKVYAKMADGSVRFYKDGYTDLRGWFDYGSLSTNEIDAVGRFAILVLSDEHGALVREAAPPKR